MGSLEKALKNFRPRVCDQNIHYSLYIILHYDALPVKKDLLRGGYCRVDLCLTVCT